MMSAIDWDELSKLEGLQPVIDPNDPKGTKNFLIDLIQWNALRKHLRSSKNVLDLGCGIGRYAKRIHKLGIQYAGIDPSRGMIQKAITLNGTENFQFQLFDGIKIPYAPESFDTVITSEVFTYILETPVGAVFLSEIKRILAPSGHLVMIEQASVSGRKSESANNILTEEDYLRVISAHFQIKNLYKVRSPDFSNFTCRVLDSPKVPLSLFRLVAWIIAAHESRLLAKATDKYFKTTSYYEFLINAQVLKN